MEFFKIKVISILLFSVTLTFSGYAQTETDSEANDTQETNAVDGQGKASKMPALLDHEINLGYNIISTKDELTSAVGVMNAAELGKITVINPSNALFGQINGLRAFQNTGYNPDERGAGLNIRGFATTGSNGILVLIDGVERPLNTVVIEEIESVTVLKDASAKAAFGQRGGNGVLLITTKRGKIGKPQFSVSFEQGISNPTRLPTFLNAPSYARAVNEAMTNDGVAAGSLRYSQSDIQQYESGANPFLYPDVDWMDETLNDGGSFSRMNFNANGGNERVRYNVGINYQNDEGLYNTNGAFDSKLDFDKLNYRTNLDITISPTTTVQVNTAGFLSFYQRPAASDIVADAFEIPSALFPVRNENGSWGGTSLFGNNPVALINDTGFDMTHTRSFLTDLRINQDLSQVVKGLGLELFGSYDTQAAFLENESKSFVYTQVTPELNDQGEIIGSTGLILGEDTDLTPSRAADESVQNAHFDLRAKINYDRTFGAHKVSAWLLTQYEQFDLPGGNARFVRQNSVASVNYGLSNKYFLNATVSYDGNNRIQVKEDRFGIFPAISAGWLISNEGFMKNINFLDALKIRGSYGKVGNDRFTNLNLTEAKFGGGPGYVFGHNFNGSPGQIEQQIPIESKTFESSYESNFGIEGQLFDKLSFAFDAFFIRRENILAPTNGIYSQTLGIEPLSEANGIVESQGIELDLTWADQVGDFNYFITARFSQYSNEIININEEQRPFPYMRREGQSIGQYFGMQAEGFYADQNDIDNSPVSEFGTVRPGDIKYLDRNDDGVINQFDEAPIGNQGFPEIYYSTSLGFGYKGFQVSALFQGTEGSSVYLNDPHLFWPLQGDDNMSTWYQNYWTENNKASAELPRLTREANQNNFRPNTIWVRDASFLKLRYLEVAYRFPEKLVDNLKLQNLTVYLRGNNLFSIDDLDYVDPENPGTTYPSLRTFNAGIKATF